VLRIAWVAGSRICIHIAWSVDLSGALRGVFSLKSDIWRQLSRGVGEDGGCGAGQFFAEGSTTTLSSVKGEF